MMDVAVEGRVSAKLNYMHAPCASGSQPTLNACSALGWSELRLADILQMVLILQCEERFVWDLARQEVQKLMPLETFRSPQTI